MNKVIIQNQVECNSCHDRPFSTHRHDFKSCQCGSISVDGGMSYLRRVGNITNYTDLSIELPEEAVKAALVEMMSAEKSGRNTLGVFCAAMRALRDNGVTFNVST